MYPVMTEEYSYLVISTEIKICDIIFANRSKVIEKEQVKIS